LDKSFSLFQINDNFAETVIFMGFDLTGKLVAKFETIQRSATFKTREFVVETNEDINGRTITNFVKFQSVQDRTSIIDRFNIGDTIKVQFNIKGSRWEKTDRSTISPTSMPGELSKSAWVQVVP
jgi:hypothetical protein